MNMKSLAADVMLIGLSASLLWHFSNIWRYGNHLVREPNIVILSVETAGLVFVLVFGVIKCIYDLKVKRSLSHISQDRTRHTGVTRNVRHTRNNRRLSRLIQTVPHRDRYHTLNVKRTLANRGGRIVAAH